MVKGKKRDRTGNVLASTPNGRLEQKEIEDTQDGVLDRRTLEDEIRELGGTAEDLELIGGADSESEIEGDDKRAASKKKGKNQEGDGKGHTKHIEGDSFCNQQE